MRSEDNESPSSPHASHHASVSSEDTMRDNDLQRTASDPPMPTAMCGGSRPSLRRKRRMQILRQRSSCSLQKSPIASTSSPCTSRPRSDFSFHSMHSYARKIRPNSIVSCTSLSCTSADYVPLGDLKRPLYTAIRKNMSPPCMTDPIIDSNAFQAAVFDRVSKSLDLPYSSTGCRSSSPTPAYITQRRSTGFSISGATELRMDLGRIRSVEGADSFNKLPQMKRPATMGGKVKNLGRGIKDMFLRRTT